MTTKVTDALRSQAAYEQARSLANSSLDSLADGPSDPLAAYFRRIGYHGSPRLDLETLAAIHRGHLTSIAYENLDIHLGRALKLEFGHTYDKIVQRGRGGWCYEMNLLLAWALCKIGFEVVLLGAAVGAETAEDRLHMDHMVVCVLLDQPWLLDAGFGNAFLEPLPLAEGKFQQAFHTFQLRQEGDYWSFQNHAQGGPGFDFLLQPRSLDEYATRCRWLQESPDSGFVKVTVCHRLMADHSILSLRNAILTTTDSSGKSQRMIETVEEYAGALTHLFGLQLSDEEIEHLWVKVWPRHLEWVKLNG